MPMGAAIAGSAVLGAMSSANAADAQEASAAMSTAEQRRQYDLTRQDQAPWREAGLQGLNKLAYLMGTDDPRMSKEQIRNQLLSKYTTTTETGGTGPNIINPNANQGMSDNELGWDYVYGGRPGMYQGQKTTTVDEAGLQAAIDAAYAAQADPTADPEFGSLLRKFGINDFQADPGYQFRLSEGTKAIDRGAAARGNLFSGAAGKALTRYNQDFASNEYGNAYNRYNTDQGNKFNRLASLAGIGQTATNQTQAAGTNMANNVSSNMIGAGNAQAAGIMGVGNALGGALNNYAQYNMMNSILGKGGASAGTSMFANTPTQWWN